MTVQLTCEQRIDAELESTLDTIRLMWEAYQNEDEPDHELENGMTVEEVHNDIAYYPEYGLGFDYVEPDTFDDQPVGYWRYQLSWGGPSDEFRFYWNGNRAYSIEYRFMDWWDGAVRTLTGEDFGLLEEIFEDLHSCQCVDY